MDYDQFKESISAEAPAEELTVYLKALWFDAKGDWEKAHILIQEIEDAMASWIHAYLHRKEGDTGNAGYWYRRAGKKNPSVTLKQEWEDIARTLIQQ